MPINYATAAVPTLAPFGTEYTPEQYVKIVASRTIPIPLSRNNKSSSMSRSFAQQS